MLGHWLSGNPEQDTVKTCEPVEGMWQSVK